MIRIRWSGRLSVNETAMVGWTAMMRAILTMTMMKVMIMNRHRHRTLDGHMKGRIERRRRWREHTNEGWRSRGRRDNEGRLLLLLQLSLAEIGWRGSPRDEFGRLSVEATERGVTGEKRWI